MKGLILVLGAAFSEASSSSAPQRQVHSYVPRACIGRAVSAPLASGWVIIAITGVSIREVPIQEVSIREVPIREVVITAEAPLGI